LLIQKQPNSWSCLPTAFAIAAHLPIQSFIHKIGHDGSDIVWPDLGEPMQRRSFHVQECVLALMRFGRVSTQIFTTSAQTPKSEVKPFITDYNALVAQMMLRFPGVIIGSVKGKNHAAACANGLIYDPNGLIYPINEDWQVWTFCPIFKCRFD